MNPAKADVLKRANAIRRALYASSLPPLGRRHMDQAVCILRRRGTSKDLRLLTAAGYSPLSYRERAKRHPVRELR